MKLLKTALKYISYALLSAILFAGAFLLLLLPIFSEGDLNAIFLYFPILPVFLILQGVLSGAMLKGKLKTAFILASPFVNIVLLLMLDLFANPGSAFSFSWLGESLGTFFTYPMFIMTTVYIIAGWLGVAAVWFFKKLSQKTKRALG